MADFEKKFRLVLDVDEKGAITGLAHLESAAKKTDATVAASGRKFDQIGAGLTKVGIGGLAVAGAIGVGLYKAGQAASDLGESVNAVEVTFGKAAGGVQKLGENAAKSMGLSNTAFNSLAVQFSAFATTIAGKGGNVVGTLQTLTQRAADFASVMNIDVADSARLFQSGLAGETEPLRKFGIDLSAAAVQAYATSKGIGGLGGALTEAEKVTARYGLLMEQTSKTQGDFANTSDSAANATRIAKAEFDNAAASLGGAVAPIMATVAGKVADLAGGFTKLNESTGGFIGKAAGVVAIGAGVAGGLSLVAGAALKMHDRFIDVKGLLTSTEGGLTRVGTAAKFAATGFAALAVAVAAKEVSDKLTSNSEQATNAMNELATGLGAVQAQGKDSQKTLELLTHSAYELEQSKSGTSKFFDVFLNGNAHESDLQLQAIKETIDNITAASPEFGQQISRALQEYKQAADSGDEATRKFLDSIGLTDDEIDKIVNKLALGASAHKALAGATDATTTATVAATDAIDNQASAIANVEKLKGDATALLWVKAIEAATTANDFLTKSLELQNTALLDLQTARENSHDLALASQKADLDAADAIDEYNKGLSDRGVSSKDVSAATKELTDATDKYNKSLEVTASSELDIRSAELDLADARVKLKAVRDDYHATDLDKAHALLEVDKAQAKLDKTMAGTSDTAEQQAAALQAVKDAQEKLAKASQPVSQKDVQQDYITTQQKIDDTASAYGDYVVNQVLGTGRVLTELEKLQIHRDAEIVSLDKQRDTVKPGSPLYQALSDYIALLEKMATIVPIDTSISGNAAGPIYGHSATGGRIPGGIPRIVGEDGPELFMPASSGTVIPAGQWGGGGGTVINIYPTINVDPTADKASIGRAIDECLGAWRRTGGRAA